MLLEDFEVVDRPFEQVLSCFRAGAEAMFASALEDARLRGEVLRARVGPPGWPVALSKRVAIRTGAPRRHGDSVLVPLHWEAVGGSSLFPHLDADLELAPFGEGQTQVVLRARYEPPGGAMGRGLDRALLHRLAQATLRSFLASICARVARASAHNAASLS